MAPIVVATAAASATESAAALGLRPSFVHGERSPAGIGPVKGGDRGLGFAVVRHFDKAKAAGSARVAICDHGGAFDGAVGLEPLAQIGFGGAEREVSNKYLFHYESFEFRLWLLWGSVSV
jgi:hypothetical protein